MKDIMIPGKRVKMELLILAICLGVATLLNIISIIIFKTNWIELISQLHVIIALGIFIYILTLLIRLIITPILKRFQKN